MSIVAPSLLASDFLNLGAACKMINRSKADWFHLDVMDGRFVPNISFGVPIVEAVKRIAEKPCDVHLMIEEPEKFTAAFAKAGADFLMVHWEACPNLHRNIQQIRELGMQPAVAINPHTPVAGLADIIADLHHVCIMSVNPGFGGQTFIPQSIEKIRQLKKMILEKKAKTLIEVDGGVTLKNAASLVAAGADVLVAGTTIFQTDDPVKTIRQFKSL